MSKPSVSVTMVIRNVERFLAESIESILGQTFADFEFIIVDFGSTDNSKSIALNYAAKDTRISVHEIPNSGLAEARNAACSLAQGRYIAIMDADDIALPHRLEVEVRFMESHPEVALLGAANEWVNSAGESICVNYFPAGDDEIRSELASHCPFCQPTVLVRREAFARAGGYRAAFAPAEDYDLWMRIAEHSQCANLSQVVLKYRIHPHQVSMRMRKQQSLGILGTQASAALRKHQKPDVFDSVAEITPDLLVSLGVTEVKQQNEFVAEYRQWLRHMCMAREYSYALDAALELSQSDLRSVERWQIADLYLTIARLYWRKRKLFSSFASFGHALTTRPVVMARPLKPLLRRLGLV